MLNVYETIQTGLHYNKFEVGDLLFVEYKCPIEDEEFGIWTPSDYMFHVLTGKKGWRTKNHHWTADAGQTFYVKKGAYIIEQFFEEEFCMLLFFISDDFIRDTVKQVLPKPESVLTPQQKQSPVIEVNNNLVLDAYFQSMLTYFTTQEKPTDTLLNLKLKELLFNVLQQKTNPELSAYFRSLQHDYRPSLRQTMDKNFCYNLSLEEYAELCSRSLSTFKRDFKKQFDMSPGKWLLKKRIEYAASLLGNTDLNITQICFESGFENISHFSRVFKEELNSSPTDYRKQLQTV